MIETTGDLEELLEVIQQILPQDAQVTVSDRWSVPGIEQPDPERVGEGVQESIAMLDLIKSLFITGKSLLKTKEELALENLDAQE